MPSSDYSSVVGGGFKLKGAKDAGISKKKKKKKSKPDGTGSSSTALSSKAGGKGEDGAVGRDALREALVEEDAAAAAASAAELTGGEEREEGKRSGKTEAQRRHDEMRRKRLDERLQKEGIKTHKERVEALNTYLSGLSEHHDMPRIGPG